MKSQINRNSGSTVKTPDDGWMDVSPALSNGCRPGGEGPGITGRLRQPRPDSLERRGVTRQRGVPLAPQALP